MENKNTNEMGRLEPDEKVIGEDVVIAIRPTAIDPSKYDVYVKTKAGRQEYALLQCVNHVARRQYYHGATLEEAREIFGALNAEDDLLLIRGEIPNQDEKYFDAVHSESDKSKSRGLEELGKEIMERTAPFRKVGRKYFSHWDEFGSSCGGTKNDK